jgi:translation initiation factor IF-2
MSPRYLGARVTFRGLPPLKLEISPSLQVGARSPPHPLRGSGHLPLPTAGGQGSSSLRPGGPNPGTRAPVGVTGQRQSRPPACPPVPRSGCSPGPSALLTGSQSLHGGGGGRLVPVPGASRSGPRRRRRRRRRRRVTLDLRNIGAGAAPRRRGRRVGGGGGARPGDRDPALAVLPASATTKTIPAVAAAASGSGSESGSQRALLPGREGAPVRAARGPGWRRGRARPRARGSPSPAGGRGRGAAGTGARPEGQYPEDVSGARPPALSAVSA